MIKKYIVLTNSFFIKNYIQITNIRYTYVAKSLNDAPTSNLDYDYDFTEEFFRHIRFYEISFNDNGQPVKLHCLSGEQQDVDFPNGWIDCNHYIQDNEYNHWFVHNNTEEGYYFESNDKLFEAILKWAKEEADYFVRDRIITSIEDKEYVD